MYYFIFIKKQTVFFHSIYQSQFSLPPQLPFPPPSPQLTGDPFLREWLPYLGSWHALLLIYDFIYWRYVFINCLVSRTSTFPNKGNNIARKNMPEQLSIDLKLECGKGPEWMRSRQNTEGYLTRKRGWTQSWEWQIIIDIYSFEITLNFS